VSALNTSLTGADNYYNRAYILFTSGANTGLRRTVRSSLNAGGVLNLLQALPVAPAAGDAFTLYPGCNKSAATCTTRFSNIVNFKGFPFVPVPETAI
jgi:uncharacterized phage protein (TIGR02218 family)